MLQSMWSQRVGHDSATELNQTGALLKMVIMKTSVAVQVLGLCTSNAGGIGLIPGQGTKTLHAMPHGQMKNKYTHFFKKMAKMWKQPHCPSVYERINKT